MSNITVTTNQQIIDVTNTSGITVTTPEGQTIAVTVPNSTVNVTNTTDDITVLTSGSLTIQNGVTYAIAANTATGGANLSLVDSNGNTDSVKFASGSGITVSRTDADTITIASTDTNTTYTISSASTTGGANLTLTGSDSSTDSVAYKGSGATTVTSTDANTITIASTDTNTTYTQNISSTSGGANLNLVGSDATTDTVKFADGTGVSVAFTDASTATISIGQSVATTANPTFAGITGGNVTVGIDTDQTISTTSGNLILQTAAGVNAGTMTLASGVNGAITLDPNGTGNIVVTLDNGGNLTNTRNYVLGDIRQTAAAAAGDVFGFLTGTTLPYRGISLSNTATATTTTGKRTGIVLRNYANNVRNTIIGEAARGTNPSSPTALVNGSNMLELVGTGYYGGGTDGWLAGSDTLSNAIRLQAMENWSATNAGSGFQVIGCPLGPYAGSTTNLLRINSNLTNIETAQYEIYDKPVAYGGTGALQFQILGGLTTVSGDLKVGGGDIQASDGQTNITMTSNTLTAVAGDLRVNGNDIQASDGNTNISMTSNTLTAVAGDLQVNGNDILASDGATNITLTSNTLTTVAGDLKVGGGDIQASDGATNITLTSNTLTTLAGDLDVKGGDITNSTGALQIATTSNGAITLAPNGTGNTVITTNLVRGSVRQSGPIANGDVWGTGATGTSGTSRGISLDNTGNTAKRNSIVMRGYNNSRSSIIGEMASGSAASPAVPGAGFTIVEMAATGYNGGGADGWVSSQNNGYTGRAFFAASETWTTTSTGTNFLVGVNPTGYVGIFPQTLQINPVSSSTNTDTFTFNNKLSVVGGNGNLQMTVTEALVSTAGDLKVGGNDIQASDGATNISMTSNTLTTLAGDLRVNGNDIQASDGANNISMTSNTLTSFAGSLKVNGDNLNGPTGGFFNIIAGTHTNMSTPEFTHFNKTPTSVAGISLHPGGDADNTGSLFYESTHTSDGTKFSKALWNTFRTTDGINFTPTLINDNLGSFGFNGNSNTSTTPGVPAGPGAQVFVYATENWSNTANGTAMNFSVIKQGTTTEYSVIKANPIQTEFQADAFIFNQTSGSKITGNKIDYNRVYGQFEYNTTITAAAANTAYVFPLGTATFNNIATVGSTSRLIIGAAGIYNLQFSVQLDNDNSQEHTAYIWLRKNGANIAGSTGRVTVVRQGSTITGWNFLVDSANTTDYYEIAYAVDDVLLTFPAYAATAFAPSTVALVTTITPVGA